ncbi:MAG: hypothetical protein CVV49_18955 [Spirochaetae bacterium HGW-Spirochaetae-5]|nr:MAG: hypothetical protein CVV49_18955 [Spirochaetae bacterium HGW-Spirochaetae-5]
MSIRKIFYGIRGTVIKSMTLISLPPLIITTIVLFLFINNYSNRLTESSLHKSVKYAILLSDLSNDNATFLNTAQNTDVSGGGFFFVMDNEGTYLAHREKKGEKDTALLSLMRGDKSFFTFSTNEKKEYLIYKEYVPSKNIYIAAGILKSDSMVLQKSFAVLLLILIIVTPFIVLMISIFIASYIRKPLNQIIETATLVSHGNLNKFIIQKHYKKCASIQDCEKTDCPAYKTSNLACWAIQDTTCFEGMKGLSKNEKINKYCTNCNVYHNSIRGEFDELIEAVNNMIVTTQHVVTSIKDVSGELGMESDKLLDTSMKLEIQMQNQAGYIEETTSSNEELAASIDSIADAAKSQANKMKNASSAMESLSESSSDVSKKAADVSGKTQIAVENANETKSILDNTTSKINQISENSQKIVEIVQIINDISDQINLLSLNASIEAARAGEHGKGFAIVAQEISKLADATAASTKEIETTIQQTRSDVNEGADLVNTTNRAIVQVMNNIKNTASLMKEIAISSEEQRKGNQSVLSDIEIINQMSTVIAETTAEQKTNSNEILKALSSINESIQVITISSQNLHTSAEGLKEKSQKLNKITDYFTV